ncbi:MAG: Xylose isomerase-like barrel protein [Frondihabitans sp.]|nr:Xylose isomerase-like barrel protein [Frondihabitans sp.]
MKFACQTYSWQMSLQKYRGRLTHMADVASQAGFRGFEAETILLPKNWSGSSLRRALDTAELELAALCLVGSWAHHGETAEERDHSDRVMDALAEFPDAIINLVILPGTNRDHLRERQSAALSCMSDIARRADDRGITVSFHPNSPPGSLFRIRPDYDLLLDELDPLIGWTPDSGHLAAGGMDPILTLREWGDRIRYVHIKDRDSGGNWAPTGTGVIDIPGIIDTLKGLGYDGWITFEDESPLAEQDPDNAVRLTGRYIQERLQEEGVPR